MNWLQASVVNTVTIAFCIFIAEIKASCVVTSERCEFPFSHDGEEYYSCISLPTNASGEASEVYCMVGSQESRSYWGACNSACLDEFGAPMQFGGEMMSAAVFCKHKDLPCVFPFIVNGVEHGSCSTDGADDGTSWCATEVDENGVMVPGKWGKCNPDLCQSKDPEAPNPEKETSPKVATATFTADNNKYNVSGEVTFEQSDSDEPIVIQGNLVGLTPGKHGFHIHKNPVGEDGICSETGPHFNPFNEKHGSLDSAERHAGDLGNMEVDEEGRAVFSRILSGQSASLFGGDTMIVGRALVIHQGEDDLGVNGEIDPESAATGASGFRIACVLIKEKEPEANLILILIIVCVIIVILLVLLILVWYCMKKRKSKIGEKVALDDDGLGYPNGDACKKSPLYDELSIPFIDASPVPTPKTGRSTERLSFFNRTPSIGRSRGSLSNEDK